MTVQVGQLFRKRTVRKLDGSIIDMTDETDGGVIISKGRIVNQAKIDEIARIQKDKEEAGKAVSAQKVVPVAVEEERAQAPGKMEALEKKVEGMEGKMDLILDLLQKK